MSDKAKFEGSIKATADAIALAAKIFAACLTTFLKMFFEKNHADHLHVSNQSGLPPEK